MIRHTIALASLEGRASRRQGDLPARRGGYVVEFVHGQQDAFRNAVRARGGHRDHPASGVLVRGVVESDLPELNRVDRAVFQEEAYPFFVLRQLFDVHAEGLLVLDPGGGRLAGYILAATTPDSCRSWVLGLGVEAGMRGLGHGRLLLGAAVDDLAAAGVPELRLSVEPGNTVALNLYRSVGFRAADHRDDYLGTGSDRLIMALALQPPGVPSPNGSLRDR